MNILNKEWNYKVQHLLYIEYKFNSDLDDDIHYDILSTSHGRFFKIHIEQNDDEQKQNCEEITNLSQLIEDYDFLKFAYIQYKFIDQLFEVEDIQPYHKMHFDIISEDGTYGLILFKHKMFDISRFDIPDILYDSLSNPLEKVKDVYKNQESEFEEYFRFCNGKERNDDYDL